MWITTRQYAEREGISVQSVTARVKRGSVKCKMEGRQRYIEVPDEAPVAPAEVAQNDSLSAERTRVLTEKYNIDNELKLAKIRNIERDVQIKAQKISIYREKLRTEFCEGTLECFTNAFSDLKAVMVDLKLRKEQIKKFKDTYGKCLNKFQKLLSEYLKKKDKEEEDEAKNDESIT